MKCPLSVERIAQIIAEHWFLSVHGGPTEAAEMVVKEIEEQ